MDLSKFNLAFCLTTTFCLSVVACSSSSTMESTDNSNQTSMPSGNGGTTTTTRNDFDGNWILPCSRVEVGGDYEVLQLSISGDTGTSINNSYTDAECTIPSTPSELSITVSLHYPGGTVTTLLGEATFVDIQGEIESLDGVTQPFLNRVDYDLMLVADDKLYLGLFDLEHSGETAETRPVELDMEDVFQRQ